MRKVSNTELSQAAKTPVLCTFNCIERVSIRKNQTGEKTMATNERMSSVKQTATMKGDKHMTTNRQTTTIEGDTHMKTNRQTTATKRVPMDSLRKTALVAGVLYLLTFVSIPTLFLYIP